MLCGDAANYVYIFWRDAAGNVTSNEKVKDNEGNDILCGTRYTIPRLYDWNNDGLKDLLVGSAANSFYLSPHPDAGKDKPGLIWLYLNTGTNANYEFTFENVLTSAAGDTVTSPTYSSFTMGDLDGDSLADLITVGGEMDSAGYFRFWKNIGSKENPSFADPEYLRKENGDIIDYPGYTRMFIDDYNYDGKADLLYNSSRSEIGGNALLANYLWVSYGISDPVLKSSYNSNIKKKHNYSITIKRKNTIQFTTSQSGNYNLKIINLNGKLVFQKGLESLGGVNDIDISKSKLSTSAYIVEIEGVDYVVREKVIIR